MTLIWLQAFDWKYFSLLMDKCEECQCTFFFYRKRKIEGSGKGKGRGREKRISFFSIEFSLYFFLCCFRIDYYWWIWNENVMAKILQSGDVYNLTLFKAGGGDIVPPPPPPGKLSKISQERLELQSWNFLTFQMNKFSKNALGFQLSPPTLGYHSNAQRWRMFSNNTFQQFSCKISPELESCLLYLWRVS